MQPEMPHMPTIPESLVNIRLCCRELCPWLQRFMLALVVGSTWPSLPALAGPINGASPSVGIQNNINILSFKTASNSSVSSTSGSGVAIFGPCQISGDANYLRINSYWQAQLFAPGDSASGSTSCAVNVSFTVAAPISGGATPLSAFFYEQYDLGTGVNFDSPDQEGVYGFEIGGDFVGSTKGAVHFGENRVIACNRLSSEYTCHNFYDGNFFTQYADPNEVFTGTLFVNLFANVHFIAEPSSAAMVILNLVWLGVLGNMNRRKFRDCSLR
jgi:hypothetical protein